MFEKNNNFVTLTLSFYFCVAIERDVEVNIEEGVRRRLRSRKRRPEMWARTVTQEHVLKGTPHTNHKRRKIAGKNVKYEECKCRFQCTVSISEEHQQALFTEYRTLPSRTQQRLFLAKFMVEAPVQRRRGTAEDSTKLRTRAVAYHLRNAKGELVRVCRLFFCRTFSISETLTKNILKSTSPTTGRYSCEHKNTSRIPWNKTEERRVRKVKTFIASIPKVPSHYCRHDSKRLYFEPTLNISKLYALYIEKIGDNPVSKFVFSQLFHDWDPPLSFYHPKKDQCSICNHKPENKYASHIDRKEAIAAAKVQDKECALADSPRTVYATFDLQALLTLPYTQDSELYYSRKLSVMNFTIHDSLGNGICNVWDESHGGKGSTEIGSCVIEYLKSLPSTTERVIFYCDTCGGQKISSLFQLCYSLLIRLNSAISL